ncbi:bifunctional dTDP-4-dehydrorhamnose 3,5-epimerase family protein/NAD(P)-dependent oxidoreductase, partial [Nocardioides sp.]|uniref:bifunctional dTDP-4-dehydrorhamnose 3,5-epimerase family protein/NAD(P)-dependent oxidoreductase n=1 Tax=Nocardioides sp. TaxID=35761 RepID=UPI002ED2C61D
MSELTVETTAIPGLRVLRLPLHVDSRGWFKESWQREKMLALGLPDFGPVQQNVSFNARRGVTRGIHAEPWDKLVSLATGRAFGAWVDLREGQGFGTVVTVELDPSVAVFVPRGVGNSYQALEDGTAYSYLVNDHWSGGQQYVAVDLADPAIGVPWPVPLQDADISDKDRQNPLLSHVSPVPRPATLILGSGGQLARALAQAFPDARTAGVRELDITDRDALEAWNWSDYDVVINAAAWTDVDGAESLPGRQQAWQTNAQGPAHLSRLATRHRLTLVHYSTDYVFDGAQDEHTEDEPLSPLGVYAQSKAAGDLAVVTTPRHLLLRTSWLVGEGKNFVATMSSLARRGVRPQVVDDQYGRLTFSHELARATRHLLDVGAPFGIYNVTNSGPVISWAEVAQRVFELCGRDPDDVVPVSTEEYATGSSPAPRPRRSGLNLAKLRSTGFEPESASAALDRYLS